MVWFTIVIHSMYIIIKVNCMFSRVVLSVSAVFRFTPFAVLAPRPF